MIILMIWFLPLTQAYLFTPVYSSQDLIPFPSYENVLTTIVGTAYVTETILTILCFVLLMKAGLPLSNNALKINIQIYLTFIFG